MLIGIRIFGIFALIPVQITISQVKPLEFSCGPLSLAGGGDGIALIDFITFIIVILSGPWHPEMQFVIRTIVVYWDVWSSGSEVRLLKRHLRGQIVKTNGIVNTGCVRADDRGRRWVLRLVDLTLDCRKSVYIYPLLVALRECVPGIHQECVCVWNARRGEQLATRGSAAGCNLTTIILVVEVVRAIWSVLFQL